MERGCLPSEELQAREPLELYFLLHTDRLSTGKDIKIKNLGRLKQMTPCVLVASGESLLQL